ncbi:unnamed protein product [Fusarium venenatum]|uniref:Uncharacterized protein n=1 Tax=Fusarium venenatum TaxID=56646 RepID=A0A2L2TWD7_9HYPO|nr:uncharacterized protein FVRRES_10334 [Fusarium venenatum]CEI70257.1 unnamed protein product [Fusarium venenatum]
MSPEDLASGNAGDATKHLDRKMVHPDGLATVVHGNAFDIESNAASSLTAGVTETLAARQNKPHNHSPHFVIHHRTTRFQHL